jgi:hypothetical protein
MMKGGERMQKTKGGGGGVANMMGVAQTLT